MSTASAPSLGGITLPMPKEQNYSYGYWGGSLEMASGIVIHDLVNPDGKRVWRLRWEFLTPAEFATVQSAFDAMKNIQVSYVDIEGEGWNARRAPGGRMEVTILGKAGGELAYHCEFEIFEGD